MRETENLLGSLYPIIEAEFLLMLRVQRSLFKIQMASGLLVFVLASSTFTLEKLLQFP